MTEALPPSHASDLALRAAPSCVSDECVAVVVHWTDLDSTLACVESLRAGTVVPSVIVVDNASGDGSGVELARRLHAVDGVAVLRAARNGGFGAGCNLGFARVLASHARATHVLLVNPDAVVDEGCVAALLATAERHPAAGIVGGRILDATGRRVQFENGRFRPWTLGPSHAAAPAGQREFRTQFVTGALMLVDAGLLRAGLRFDETFFLYVEDLDFCREVVARGRELWIDTTASCRHVDGGSQRDDPPVLGAMRAGQLEHMARGKAYFARKRLSGPQQAVFFATAFVLRPLVGLAWSRSLRFLRPWFRGLRAGLREPVPERRAPR